MVIVIQEISESEKLQRLRSSIAENSQNLVDLFRERALLAQEIGRVKREAGLPPRIREREEAVLEGLGGMDRLSRSIMSSLFEFSIINEHDSTYIDARHNLEGREFIIHGPRPNLELLAGLLLSRPGVDFYSGKPLPEALEAGIQVNGGHIIFGEPKEPDITVCLGENEETCDFRITGSGEMHFSLKFPVKAGDVSVRVIQ